MIRQIPSPSLRQTAVVLLLMAAVAASAWGCSDGGASTTTALSSPSGSETTAPAGDATTATTAQAPDTTSPAPPSTLMTPERKQLAQDLKEAGQLGLRLAEYLQQQGAPANDPRMALAWGLRAMGQAATVKAALLDSQRDLADQALVEMRKHLGRAQAFAQGDTATAIAAAQKDLSAITAKPSADPKAAATAMDAVMDDLKPLLDAAKAIIPETTTPTSTS